MFKISIQADQLIEETENVGIYVTSLAIQIMGDFVYLRVVGRRAIGGAMGDVCF